MRSITRLFGALGTLADSILALSAVVDVATGKLRQPLALDVEPAPALEHAGEVLYGNADPAPASRRNGRTARAHAEHLACPTPRRRRPRRPLLEIVTLVTPTRGRLPGCFVGGQKFGYR